MMQLCKTGEVLTTKVLAHVVCLCSAYICPRLTNYSQ
jgi:hypothetical protein